MENTSKKAVSKMNWKLIGGILAVVAIIALVVYKPWLSKEEKAKLALEKKAKADAEAEKAKLEAEKAKAKTGASTLMATPVGKAAFVAN